MLFSAKLEVICYTIGNPQICFKYTGEESIKDEKPQFMEDTMAERREGSGKGVCTCREGGQELLGPRTLSRAT